MNPLKIILENKYLIKLAILSLVFGAIMVPLQIISARSGNCGNALVIFARGSGQEQGRPDDQPQTYTFFDEIKARSSDPDSIKTFGLTYDAVSWPHFGNAEIFWVAGDYRRSVEQGVGNLLSLVRSEINQCPGQQIVLGGYSQGAQVVGNALQQMNSQELASITYVGLFGDPKFNPASFAARGSFDNRPGVLEARRSEFPLALKGRISSWCRKHDGICQNGALFRIIGPFSEHDRYQEKEVLVAANEAAAWLSKTLTGIQPAPFETDKPAKLDVVVVFSGSGTADSNVSSSYTSHRSNFLDPVFETAEDVRLGLTDYVHQVNNEEIARNYLPLSDKSGIDIFSMQPRTHHKTGRDRQPQFSGLLAAINGQPWRSDAQKVLILAGSCCAQEPEKDTGYTLQDVVRAALAKDTSIYPVLASDHPSNVNNVNRYAEGTGGFTTFFPHPERFKSNAYALEVLNSLHLQPRVISDKDLLIGIPGQPLLLHIGEAYAPSGTIATYEWDMNNDGIFEATTPGPTMEHTFAANYDGDVAVRLTSADGLSKIVKLPVSVNALHEAITPPGPVRNLQVDLARDPRRGFSFLNTFAAAGVAQTETVSARLTWQPPAHNGGEPLAGYAIYGNGDLLGAVAAGRTSVIIREVPLGVQFSVVAVNKAGFSAAAETETIDETMLPEEVDPQPSTGVVEETTTLTADLPAANGQTVSGAPAESDPADSKPALSLVAASNEAGTQSAEKFTIAARRAPWMYGLVALAVMSLGGYFWLGYRSKV